MSWQPIETLPAHAEAVVCCTYNVPSDDDDPRPPAREGYVWETAIWTDWFDSKRGWFRYPRLIEIPFPPTHWMPLPEPPQ
jgi:hypothetical protein